MTSFTIWNAEGEDVTDHFTNIRLEDGKLTVLPAPLTVITGSAEKEYDGLPLTCETACLLCSAPADGDWDSVECAGYAGQDEDGVFLLGLWGELPVYGADPLTGEPVQTVLLAGQKLRVLLAGGVDSPCLTFRTEATDASALPKEVLRFFAEHEDLLIRACQETGWDISYVRLLIEGLPSGRTDGALIANGACVEVVLSGLEANTRPLQGQEARITGFAQAAGIAVIATGSQTETGESPNTYRIEWGGALPENYAVMERLGTLMVRPAPTACPHDWGRGEITRSATCVFTGQRLYRCRYCGKTRTEVIPTDPDRHTGETTVTGAAEPTCVSPGYTGDTVCASCGAVLANGERLPADPERHAGGTTVVGAQEPTCILAGYTGDTVCASCGAKLSKGTFLPIDPARHAGGVRTSGAMEATCVSVGYTGDTVCQGCGAELEKGQTIPADPEHHAGPVETVNAQEATCVSPGYTGATVCRACGAMVALGETIPIDPSHHIGETETRNAKAPTCVSPGETGTVVCLACGGVVRESSPVPVDPDRHLSIETSWMTEPTCTEPGFTGVDYCADCGAVLFEGDEIPALGHSWPSVLNLMGKEIYCTRCGERLFP